MKVLLLNTYDSDGGAAIATARLAEALSGSGIDVKLGVKRKNTTKNIVFQVPHKKANLFFQYTRLIQKIILKINQKILHVSLFKTTNPIYHSQNKGSFIDVQFINSSDFDLVHLHWINDDMISIEDIAKITKPILWTMHDSWIFCGAEHHPNIWENDSRYKDGYTKITRPMTTKGPDICRYTWERKKKYLKNKQITFISPSTFEKELMKESALFSGSSYIVIPNITPSVIFHPQNKKSIRELLNLPADKKIIGFGAAYEISNIKSNKGGHFLIEALNKINHPEDYLLLIFGPANNEFLREIKIPVFFAGFIENQNILATLYNACDVFVCPSVIENLPLTCLESLFCGIPIAAFNTGGIPDVVEHKKTGYLAPLFNTEELYKGILYCIDNQEYLSKQSLIKARNEFNELEICKKHIELYRSLID